MPEGLSKDLHVKNSLDGDYKGEWVGLSQLELNTQQNCAVP